MFECVGAKLAFEIISAVKKVYCTFLLLNLLCYYRDSLIKFYDAIFKFLINCRNWFILLTQKNLRLLSHTDYSIA